jgi:hypothetical protein
MFLNSLMAVIAAIYIIQLVLHHRAVKKLKSAKEPQISPQMN